MTPVAVLTALLLGVAVALLLPVRPELAPHPSPEPARGVGGQPSSPRWHLALSLVAGLSAGLLVGGGWLGTVVVTAAVAFGTSRLLTRSADAGPRREYEAAMRELPHLVGLLAAGLKAGAAPPAALEAACRALPGPAADLMSDLRPRLVWGADPAEVWAELTHDPVLGPLGRTLTRAHETGASVAEGIDVLAGHLAGEARAQVEDRARAVGVRAALPLGVCLLPAFLLLGIVPSVAGLVSQLTLR